MKRTYQTRIDVTDAQGDHLERYASLYGKCERTLFAETIAQSKAPESVKSAYLRRFDITGSHSTLLTDPGSHEVARIITEQIDETLGDEAIIPETGDE